MGSPVVPTRLKPVRMGAVFDTWRHGPCIRVSKTAHVRTAITYGLYVRAVHTGHVYRKCVPRLKLEGPKRTEMITRHTLMMVKAGCGQVIQVSARPVS